MSYGALSQVWGCPSLAAAPPLANWSPWLFHGRGGRLTAGGWYVRARQNAISALNKGAKLGGFYHNTGEGGISRFHKEPGGDIVWNVGTGYFGCRTKDGQFCPEMFVETASLPQVKMIEIKLSQVAPLPPLPVPPPAAPPSPTPLSGGPPRARVRRGPSLGTAGSCRRPS